jgi:hypothetical protein
MRPATISWIKMPRQGLVVRSYLTFDFMTFLQQSVIRSSSDCVGLVGLGPAAAYGTVGEMSERQASDAGTHIEGPKPRTCH